MAVLLVILIGIVLSMIPFFIDKGKEQIKVKKVKDTFYTMTGSKFFSDTLLGKHFANAMKNKGYNYQRTLTSGNVKEIKDELYKIAFDYAVKKKMVWGQDDYTKAVIQFCDSDDSVIQRAYDMIIAEKNIIKSAQNSVEHDGMPWMTSSSISASTSSTLSRFGTPYDEYIYNERIRYANKLLNPNKDGLSFGEKELDIFSKIRYNRVYIEVPNNAKEIPIELFEMSKARVIFLPISIERIDVDKMQKFDIVIIPKEKNDLFRKMLESYKGVIIDNSERSNVWLGNPISFNDFILIHGDYELKQPNEYIKMHYIVTNDGEKAYFTKRLEDQYNLLIQEGENTILENADLLIEEYYSVEQKKFYLGIYER